MAFFSIANAGDEILVFEPFYANYNGFAAVNSVRLVPVPTSISDGFHLPDRKTIEKYISPKTRAIILCNPNNPTGTVYSQKEVEILISIARDRNLYFMSDEVYREFIYDGRTHVSALDYMKANSDRVILLDSLSKRFSVCGIRIGVLVSLNMDLMSGALRIAQGRLSSGYVDQKIAERMDSVPDGYLDSVRSEYDRRRIMLYEGLKSIPGVTVPKPEGAFYVIAGLPVDNAEDFCKWLLTDFRDNNETVMLAPASGFYATAGAGKKEVRIAYVLNGKSLLRSIEILRKALDRYRKI
jgi:aspartate aminotransferase